MLYSHHADAVCSLPAPCSFIRSRYPPVNCDKQNDPRADITGDFNRWCQYACMLPFPFLPTSSHFSRLQATLLLYQIIISACGIQVTFCEKHLQDLEVCVSYQIYPPIAVYGVRRPRSVLHTQCPRNVSDKQCPEGFNKRIK